VSGAQLAAFRTRLGGQLPDIALDDNILNQFVTADLDDRQVGVSSQLSFDLSGTTLRLIDSYRDWKSVQLDGDVIFTPLPIASRSGNYRSKSHNHELQLISPTRQWLGGHLDTVAGLYFFHEDYQLGENLHMNAQYCNALVAAGPGRDACNAFLKSNGGQNATDQDVQQSVSSYAAYAQGDVHVSDALSFVLGGRYTRDEKSGAYSQKISNPFVMPLRAPEALTFPNVNEHRFTYRLGVNYQPNRDILLFASYSTGYKSGGYNSGAGSPALSTFDAQGRLISTRRLFGAETVKDAELGAKTTWLERRVTANLTFYRMDISGYQDRAFDGTSFTVRNAGNLRQQGFELDTVFRPLRPLSLTASLAYLDSNFTDYANAAALPGIGGVQDLKGKPVTFSPKWSGRLAADWSGSIGAGWSFDANANLSFVSRQYLGLVTDANPQTIEPRHALLGARLTLNSPNDRWSASIFSSNLTNTQYSPGNLYQVLDSAFGLRNGVFPGSTAVRRLHADPRTYGASVSFRF
jgi:iron complex outermembrane receptor protein